MSVASSLGNSSAYGMGTYASSYQLEALLDDIRMEEGDVVDLPMVSFSQIQVHEIVTEGSFKYYHGHTQDGDETVPSYVALKCLKGQDHSIKRGLQWIQETKLLADLKHDHIRNIHAQSIVSLADSLEEGNHAIGIADRYFLVVDPIQETLARRLEEWRSSDSDCFSYGGRRNSLSNMGRRNSLNNINKFDALGRVKFVAQDVIKALSYLHSKDVAFGKLATDKIGFDNKGILKLVDFSDASVVEEENKEKMFAQDMYYFGLLLWELFTLTAPKEKRPALRGAIHSDPLRQFLEQCWNKDIETRPKFSKRLAKRMMEITSTCRHNLVATNQRELGEEYSSSSLSMERSSSLRNLMSPKTSKRKSFRVSKVNLTFDVYSRRSSWSGSKIAWDAGTASTSNSDLSS